MEGDKFFKGCGKVSARELKVILDEREKFGIGSRAREMSNCGVDAIRFDEVLNFDSFFVFGVIELQSGGDNFCQRVGNKSALKKLCRRAYQAVGGRKFTFRAASYAGNFIAQVRILKARFGRRYILLLSINSAEVSAQTARAAATISSSCIALLISV